MTDGWQTSSMQWMRWNRCAWTIFAGAPMFPLDSWFNYGGRPANVREPVATFFELA
jgi:hypothetical protein